MMIWLAVIFLLLSLNKKLRQGFMGVLRTLFTAKSLLFALGLLAIYTAICVCLLFQVQFWDWLLLKDTIIWFFAFAVVTSLSKSKTQGDDFFKPLLKEIVTWTIVLEFLLNFYTFNFWLEMVIIPFATLASILLVVAEMKPETQIVATFLKSLLSIIGIGLFVGATYSFFIAPLSFFTWSTLQSFLLPIVLSLTFIPFYYFLQLYIEYEGLLIRISFNFQDPGLKKQLRRAIFRAAHINLGNLRRIRKEIYDRKREIYSTNNMRALIHSFAQ